MAIGSFIRSHKKVSIAVILGLLLAGAWLWPATAYLRGNLVARKDVRNGHYKVLAYGLPTAWRPQYARCLRERYNVELDTAAGCIVSQSLTEYVDGYHSVVAEATKRRFGRDIYAACVDQAQNEWNATNSVAPTAKPVNSGR